MWMYVSFCSAQLHSIDSHAQQHERSELASPCTNRERVIAGVELRIDDVTCHVTQSDTYARFRTAARVSAVVPYNVGGTAKCLFMNYCPSRFLYSATYALEVWVHLTYYLSTRELHLESPTFLQVMFFLSTTTCTCNRQTKVNYFISSSFKIKNRRFCKKTQNN